MKKYMAKKSNKIILMGILFIQIMFMIFYCNMKKGFFVDEVWSYGLANSYYHAQIWEDGALDNAEVDPNMFKDYLTVNEGETFKFGSVIYNQTHDSHPPLFYIVLHAISSCFPGKFSKWFGLIPNLFYYLITIIFLYKIGRLVSKNKYFAYFPIIFYGFSIAAVNTVTYVRMYMLLTMWCMIFIYEHLKIILKRKIKSVDIVSIIISTFGGIFTHYYFAIFAFPVVVVQMIWMIMRKDWKMTVKYVLSGSVGGICAIVSYPTILKNLTGTGVSHSQTTVENMHNFSDWFVRIKQFLKIISDEMFGSVFTGVILIGIFCIIIYIVTHILFEMTLEYNENHYEITVKNKRISKVVSIKRENYLVWDIIICSTFCFAIAAKISPWQVNRYIMNLFPLFSLIFCYAICCIYKIWIKTRIKRLIVIVISLLIVGRLTYYTNDPCYLYPEGENNIAISKEFSDTSCVYIYTLSYIMVSEGLELQNYNRLYQMNYKEIDKNIPNILVENSKLVVYIDKILDQEYDAFGEKNEMNTEECLNRIGDLTGLKKSKALYQDEKAYVYELYK